MKKTNTSRAALRQPAQRPGALVAALSAALSAALLLAGCGNNPPVPDWQMNAHSSIERATAAYMAGNARVEAAESARARDALASTGKVDLIIRAELIHCAARVASLVFEDCAGYDKLSQDASPADRTYATYLAGRLPAPAALSLTAPAPTLRTQSAASATGAVPVDPAQHPASANAVAPAANAPRTADAPAPTSPSGAAAAPAPSASDIAMLPEQHRAVAAANGDAAAVSAVQAIADPLSRLVASGVLLRTGRANPQILADAVETASAQGWRRPLLAWLGVQAMRAEQAGDTAEAQRIKRRIALITNKT